jgi:hypothetical protein
MFSLLELLAEVQSFGNRKLLEKSYSIDFAAEAANLYIPPMSLAFTITHLLIVSCGWPSLSPS